MTVLDARVRDGELLRRFAAGDATREEAFAELVGRHLGWVYGVARRMTGDAGLAEDVAQGVFLAMSQKAGKLAGHPCLAAWLFEATRMGSGTLMRGRRREKERERVVAAEAARREAGEGVDAELVGRVDAAVGRLREGERRVVLLHFYSQMSVVEVGAVMGMSEAAVRKRLWRSVEKLRGWLGVKGDAAGFGGVMAGVLGVKVPSGLEKVVVARGGGAGALRLGKVIARRSVSKLSVYYGAVGGICVVAGMVAAVVSRSWGVAEVKAGAPVEVVASGPATQAILARIHSFEVRGTQTIEGRPDSVRVTEEYFDRQNGSVRREIYPHGVYVMRSGADYLVYREGSSVADRAMPMVGALAAAFQRSQEFEFNSLLIDRGRVRRRAPEKDLVVGGKKLACYEMNSEGATDSYQWTDEEGLVVRGTYTSVPRPGESAVTWKSERTFNPELPGDFWKLPATMKVAEPWEVVGKAFPLEKAVFQREVHGTIAAVHSVRQDENGVFYLVISTRVTEETFKNLESATVRPNGAKRLRGGSTELLSWDEKAQKLTREFSDHTIASLRCDGMWVSFVAVTARDPAAAGDRCRLTFTLSPDATADELSGKASPPHAYVSFDLRASSKITAEAFAGEAYDALSSVDQGWGVELEAPSVPFKSTQRTKSFKPAELGKEEFEEAVGRDVGRWGGVP